SLDTSGANNAFIMRMGPLVAVEFSGLGNAFYAYDSRKTLPFETTQMLRLEVNGRNSLKQKSSAILNMRHQDGIHNWSRWEDMFAATLRQHFSIEPAPPAARRVAAEREVVPIRTRADEGRQASFTSLPFSRALLDRFAKE